MARAITESHSLIHHKLSIKDFYNKRNKILIVRDTGGLGDILMCRMLFEDFKRIIPDSYLVFACPKLYHEAVNDHPFIDEVVDSRKINENDFILSYNITSSCGKYENKIAPLSDKNRSDIWANHCGVELTRHNMHLNINSELTQECRQLIEQHRQNESGHKGLIAFCPVSAMLSKNLAPEQSIPVVQEMQKMGFLVYSVHKQPIDYLNSCRVPVFTNLNLNEWMGFLNAADYVVGVDSAAIHLAGGISKPFTAIFTWADGYIYTKHYQKKSIVQLHRNTHSDWTCGPCYQWGLCPKTNAIRKPCLTELSSAMILEGVEKMLRDYPLT